MCQMSHILSFFHCVSCRSQKSLQLVSFKLYQNDMHKPEFNRDGMSPSREQCSGFTG